MKPLNSFDKEPLSPILIENVDIRYFIIKNTLSKFAKEASRKKKRDAEAQHLPKVIRIQSFLERCHSNTPSTPSLARRRVRVLDRLQTVHIKLEREEGFQKEAFQLVSDAIKELSAEQEKEKSAKLGDHSERLRTEVEDFYNTSSRPYSSPTVRKYLATCVEEFCKNKEDQDILDALADGVAEPFYQSDVYSKCSFEKTLYTYPLITIICPHAKKTSYAQLFAAVICNNERRVKECLKAGLSPNAKMPATNYCAFHFAVINDCTGVMRCFLDHPDFNLSDYPSHLEGKKIPIMALAKSTAALGMLLSKGIFHCRPPSVSDRILNPTLLQEQIYQYDGRIERLNMIEMVLKHDPTLAKARQNSGASLLWELYLAASQQEQALRRLFCLPDRLEINAIKALFELVMRYHPRPIDCEVLDSIQERTLAGDRYFLQHVTPEERAAIEDHVKLTRTPLHVLLSRHRDMRIRLVNEVLKYNLRPEDISLELLYEAYLLKKETKRLMRSDTAETKSIAASSDYQSFVQAYDAAVSRHPVLKMLRELSHSIRNRADGLTLYKFDKVAALWNTSVDSWKSDSASVRRKISEAQKIVKGLPPTHRMLTLVHGTKTPAVALMLHLGMKIIASGQIFNQGAAPLTGEAAAAIGGHNVEWISTLSPDSRWEEPKIRFQEPIGAPTRFLTAENYSKNGLHVTGGHRRPLIFDRETEYGKLQQCTHELLTNTLSGLRSIFWFDLKRTIYRLRMTDPGFKKRTESLLEQLSKHTPTVYPGEETQKLFAEILKVWREDPPFTVSISDPLIATPAPILFASTTHVETTRHGEEVLAKELAFGRDLQLAFTQESEIRYLQGILGEHGITVLPFCAGHYMEMLQMSRGSARCVAFQARNINALTAHLVATVSKEISEQIARVLSIALQRVCSDSSSFSFYLQEEFAKQVQTESNAELLCDHLRSSIKSIVNLKQLVLQFHQGVLPYYAAPLPEHPFFVNETGQKQRTDRWYGPEFGTSYEAYIKAVSHPDPREAALPRSIHGAMHSTRTALLTIMIAEMYRKVHLPPNVNLFLLGMAAGMHDAARQTEGKDLWDRASADLFKRNLIQEGALLAPRNEVDILHRALAEKEPSNGSYTSLEHEMINGADCFEIHRCLGDPTTNFIKTRLPFYTRPEFAAFPRDALIDEVAEFIKITESMALKRYMEHYSQDYLSDLARIFSFLHQSSTRFPLMASLLAPVCAALEISPTDLPEAIRKVLG